MTGREHLYDLIKESFLLLDFGDRTLFERYGLSVSRYYALHHIAGNPGLSPSRLSQLMFCDKSNITRLLQGLEADGYVTRHVHERDARIQRLFLTDKGLRLHREVWTVHLTFIEQRLGLLSSEDSQQLETTLDCFIRALAEARSLNG
ncbi:MAG TPA: MarR family transcriptional regulator [Promineifilum sp.]|nr:MarR family transcriptional regulator [Promineifilum sp.]